MNNIIDWKTRRPISPEVQLERKAALEEKTASRNETMKGRLWEMGRRLEHEKFMLKREEATLVAERVYKKIDELKISKRLKKKEDVAKRAWGADIDQPTSKLRYFQIRPGEKGEKIINRIKRHGCLYLPLVDAISHFSDESKEDLLLSIFGNTSADPVKDLQRQNVPWDYYSSFIDYVRHEAKSIGERCGLSRYFREVTRYGMGRKRSTMVYDMEEEGEPLLVTDGWDGDVLGRVTKGHLPIARSPEHQYWPDMGVLPSAPLYRFPVVEPREYEVRLSRKSISFVDFRREQGVRSSGILKTLYKEAACSQSQRLWLWVCLEVRIALAPYNDEGCPSPVFEMNPLILIRNADRFPDEGETKTWMYHPYFLDSGLGDGDEYYQPGVSWLTDGRQVFSAYEVDVRKGTDSGQYETYSSHLEDTPWVIGGVRYLDLDDSPPDFTSICYVDFNAESCHRWLVEIPAIQQRSGLLEEMFWNGGLHRRGLPFPPHTIGSKLKANLENRDARSIIKQLEKLSIRLSRASYKAING